jgi:hypothetical protein
MKDFNRKLLHPITPSLCVISLLLIFGCSGNKSMEINPIDAQIILKNDTDCKAENQDDYLTSYFRIVDSTYTMEKVNDGDTWRIDVKIESIKKAQPDDEFRITDYYVCGRTYLWLVDDVGTYIEEWGGVGGFDATNYDAMVDFLKNDKKEMVLRFENDAYKFEDYMKNPENIAGFVIRSSAHKVSAKKEEVTTSSAPVSGATGADGMISKFEKLLNQYINLDKKLDELDPDSKRWDTTYDEFDKLEDQLIDLQIELEDLEYDGKLTPSQKTKFNRLSTKFDDY